MARKKVKTQPITTDFYLYRLAERVQTIGVCAFYSEWSERDYFVLCVITNRTVSDRKTSSKRKAGTSALYDYIAYRFCGHPDAVQEHELNQNIGAARWMWNRFKADDEEHYRQMGFSCECTPADYKEDYRWLKDVDSFALCNVQLNYEKAKSEWLSGERGRPRFKKKRACSDSYTTNKNIRLENGCLTLPKITGAIKLSMHREIEPGGTLKRVTVTHEPNGRWYFSIVVEYPKAEYTIPCWMEDLLQYGDFTNVKHTGLDMSLPHLYIDTEGNTPSYKLNGITVSFVKAYRQLEAKIGREQRKLSRMVKGSNNYNRQMVKIAKLYAKAKHRRSDFLHQMAVRLARQHDIISIEDLNMSAIKQSLKFGKSASDIGWGMFVKILEEKCLQYGTLLVKVDKWFPSSKTCSHCGHVHKELKLSDRTYICPVCGHVMDRDRQAAINIDREGFRLVLEALLDPPVYRQRRKQAA